MPIHEIHVPVIIWIQILLQAHFIHRCHGAPSGIAAAEAQVDRHLVQRGAQGTLPGCPSKCLEALAARIHGIPVVGSLVRNANLALEKTRTRTHPHRAPGIGRQEGVVIAFQGEILQEVKFFDSPRISQRPFSVQRIAQSDVDSSLIAQAWSTIDEALVAAKRLGVAQGIRLDRLKSIPPVRGEIRDKTPRHGGVQHVPNRLDGASTHIENPIDRGGCPGAHTILARSKKAGHRIPLHRLGQAVPPIIQCIRVPALLVSGVGVDRNETQDLDVGPHVCAVVDPGAQSIRCKKDIWGGHFGQQTTRFIASLHAICHADFLIPSGPPHGIAPSKGLNAAHSKVDVRQAQRQGPILVVLSVAGCRRKRKGAAGPALGIADRRRHVVLLKILGVGRGVFKETACGQFYPGTKLLARMRFGILAMAPSQPVIA